MLTQPWGPARPADLHDALEALESASRTPAKQRAVKVSSTVNAICQHALAQGLDPAALQVIIKVVTRKTELDQTSVTSLVKSLYPSSRVSAEVVITVVGALGQGKGKPSTATQINLVKWLTTIFEVLQEPKILSRLYGVLFGMLDMISLRTSLCHLLSLITRRTHVKPFRIQQLLELSRGVGNEPALQGLLRVYKDYYPDIILGNASLSRTSFPPRPDPEWRKCLDAIHEADRRRQEGSLGQQNGFKVLRNGTKRSKVSVVPELHTFHAQETSVTLEEIDNVDDFVEKFDSIELPGQLISFLRDPVLQKYLMLNPSEIALRRIDLWLSACLEEEYEAAKQGTRPSTQFIELLEGVLCHTRYTKTILPTVDAFLRAYLPLWDGVTGDDLLIDILAYIPIARFQDVYDSYLAPAENALQLQNPTAAQKVLRLYTGLLRNWTIGASSDVNGSENNTHHATRLEDLVKHVSKLSTSILCSSQNIPADNLSSILTFYEVLSTSSVPLVIPILFPPRHLTYSLIVDSCLTTLSRTCDILANYKKAFDSHPTPISAYYSTETLALFNGYLMDTCNLLWRSRALLDVDPNAVGCYISSPVREALHTYLTTLDREYTISSIFGFSHNALLASASAAAWRAMEEAEIKKQGYDEDAIVRHKGPVTQRTLAVLGKEGGVQIPWKQYRVFVLRWLHERGCGGIRQLMFATMTGLKDVAA